MKIVDAVWEKRNLGKECKEIYIEKTDEMPEVFQKLKDVEVEFCELFVPIECPEYLLQLPQYGYCYIESNFDLIKQCREYDAIPKMYDRILDKVSSRQIEKDDVPSFLEKIRTEFFFDKDKISIDYHFSKELSANRNYWRLRDYYSDGRDLRIYEVLYEQDAIGYFILEIMEQGRMEVHLSGLYPEHRSKNLGICIMGEETRRAARLGGRMLTTGVSLNNFSCLRIYLSLGYEIKRAMNIFVKHEGDTYVSKG